MMFVGRYMDKFEVEEKDSSNPLIDDCIGLYVRISEHTLDELGIHFYNQVVDANQMHV